MICQNCIENMIEEDVRINYSWGFYASLLRCEKCGKKIKFHAKYEFPYEYEDEIQNKKINASTSLAHNFCPYCDDRFIEDFNFEKPIGKITVLQTNTELKEIIDRDYKYMKKVNLHCNNCDNSFLVPIKLYDVEIEDL